MSIRQYKASRELVLEELFQLNGIMGIFKLRFFNINPSCSFLIWKQELLCNSMKMNVKKIIFILIYLNLIRNYMWFMRVRIFPYVGLTESFQTVLSCRNEAIGKCLEQQPSLLRLHFFILVFQNNRTIIGLWSCKQFRWGKRYIIL